MLYMRSIIGIAILSRFCNDFMERALPYELAIRIEHTNHHIAFRWISTEAINPQFAVHNLAMFHLVCRSAHTIEAIQPDRLQWWR